MTAKPLRYVVQNPYEEIPASYNAALGTKAAERYAMQNAQWRRSRIIVEWSDGTSNVLADFTER